MIAAAQFGVHRSPSHSGVRLFGTVLQSGDFGRMPTRIVAPLVRPDAMPQLDDENARVASIFLVRRQRCVLNPFDLATLGVNRLGELVVSFGDDDDAKRRTKDALDIVLTPF